MSEQIEFLERAKRAAQSGNYQDCELALHAYANAERARLACWQSPKDALSADEREQRLVLWVQLLEVIQIQKRAQHSPVQSVT